MLDQLLDLLSRARVHDLSQPYYVGMPHFPTHPPFLYGLAKAHGDFVGEAGQSSASENLGLGGHVGTHIDALCHFSKEGMLHGGVPVSEAQSGYGVGMSRHGVETIEPMLRRGVLLDVAGVVGEEVLGPDFVIDAALLERTANQAEVEIREGDVVLVRTGLDTLWDDGARYINEGKQAGINLEAAQWLSAKGILAAGSDSIALEHVPSTRMPVHVHLLVESGIHIIEALDLKGLARARTYEFAFLAAPLKLVGGTGAPIRPLAASL